MLVGQIHESTDVVVSGSLIQWGREVEDGWRGVRPDRTEVHVRHAEPDKVARISKHDRLLLRGRFPIPGSITLSEWGLIKLERAAPPA